MDGDDNDGDVDDGDDDGGGEYDVKTYIDRARDPETSSIHQGYTTHSQGHSDNEHFALTLNYNTITNNTIIAIILCLYFRALGKTQGSR